MVSVNVEQLRDEAVLSINSSIAYLKDQFSEYRPLFSQPNRGGVRVRAESEKSIIDFQWDYRDKHHILLGPRMAYDCRELLSKQGVEIKEPRLYGIGTLVQFGGRRHPYIEFRKDPLIGVNALIEWVPEFVSGDWSRQSKLELMIQNEIDKRKAH